MAFGQETAEQLWQELVRGYNLNAELLALLVHPLDIRDQEAAAAMSQELSRVFMVSLFTLKPGDISRVVQVRRAAPEATNTEGSTGQSSPAKTKRICGQEVAPNKKIRGDEVTKKEITASPHKDGYRWKKYGQKNIRDRKFARLYYSCRHSHERGCRAKKQVHEQDNSSDSSPMYQVTYVNDHTCHQVLPSQSISDATNLPAKNTAIMTRNGADFDPAIHVGDNNAGLQNKTMACDLTTVIGGAPTTPPSVEVSQLSEPASYVPPMEVSMGLEEYETTVAEMGFSCCSPLTPVEAPADLSSSSMSPPLPIEARSSYLVGGGNIPSTDAMTMEEMYSSWGPLFSPVAAHSISQWDDVPMAVVAGRYTDTGSAWPQ
ncbi:unnamed protein product [Alopecurus aequalis]